MATKPGEIVASKMPRKNRTVARPAKELQEAVIKRILAQIMILTAVVSKRKNKREDKLLPRNFAIGNLWSRATPGYSAIR
jgi:hypothetical protein